MSNMNNKFQSFDRPLPDHILLKWGTLKAWDFSNSPEAKKAMEEYIKIGASYSAMTQKDTPRQKELICEMIDKVNGSVWLDWDGIDCTNDRQQAKDYVMNYNKQKH